MFVETRNLLGKHFPNLYDHGTYKEHTALILTRLGQTLYEYGLKNAFPYQMVCHVARDVVIIHFKSWTLKKIVSKILERCISQISAVKFLHMVEMTHGDIKSKNVAFGPEDDVYCKEFFVFGMIGGNMSAYFTL